MMKALPIVIPLLGVLGCAQLQMLHLAPRSDWDRALSEARQSVDAGNYFVADKVIEEFIRAHPNTREAREMTFWKAAYMLDPANAGGSLASGIAGLDGYLTSNPKGRYRSEAKVLRRTAAVAQGIMNPVKTVSTEPLVTPAVKDTVIINNTRSRDEQIAALRDQLTKSREELAKVTAELERIKKRLANPSS
jgi:hypothetical protein